MLEGFMIVAIAIAVMAVVTVFMGVKTIPLLSRAGADSIDPDIRNKINRETAVLVHADSNFIRRLLNFESDPAEVVDAPAEARRLRENQALGRKANEGDTPLIERKSDQLFNVF